jgi:hypothetical protein
MSHKPAILASFNALLCTRPTTALWLLSVVMAAKSKPVAQRALAKYIARGPLVRELSSALEKQHTLCKSDPSTSRAHA